MTSDENSRLFRLERSISEMRLDLQKILQRLDREVEPESDDHEARLRKVERLAQFAIGACAILTALGVWAVVANVLHLVP